MDIRSSLDGLKTLLGIAPTTGAAWKANSGSAQDEGSLITDRATLSSAGSEVAHSASDGGVRTAKVAEIQAALQAGTYDVPASAVATKMVDAMLENRK